jgi:hypothetical protein
MLRQSVVLVTLLASSFLCAVAQQKAPPPSADQNSSRPSDPLKDPSGMYTFLKDGEFVQLNIEEGKLSGYISRYGETDSDKGQFIDQFFEKAALDGDSVSFTTKVVHGVSYEFRGRVSIAGGKQPGQEGYRVLKGTLTQHAADASGNDKASQREVEFKSFPEDMGRS